MVVALSSRTQGLVLAFLAAVLIRMSLTGEYLRFVAPWMRWPLLVTGIVLLAMAIRPVLTWSVSRSGGAIPASAWLLLLPPVVFFAVSPPPLGAFVAERRTADPASLPEPGVVGLPQGGGPVAITVSEFVWGVSQPGDPMGVSGRRVTMTGFVSHGKDGWYVTMLNIGCCAADAVVSRVLVAGHAAPPRDQWLEVTGTWVEGTGLRPGVPATLKAERVVEVDPPREVYG